MKSALSLAARGAGRVSPNPMVGCVIVKNGKIVGKGYHGFFGGPHAETEALSDAGRASCGGTMYVNLEPCCHFGKTPPCTKAIIKSGIKRVMTGMKDPNPLIDGRGVAELERHGIRTETGILECEARRLNESYIKYTGTGKPFVILKTAMTLDGKIAAVTGDSRWISNERSRSYVHALRSRVDAVLVGINTVLKDNPALLSGRGGRNPRRIILDCFLRMPLDARVLERCADTLVVAGSYKEKKIKMIEKTGAGVIVLESSEGKIDLKQLMKELGGMSITSLLVEGGSEVNTSFLRQGLVDKVLFFVAPKITGGSLSPSPFTGKGVAMMKDAIALKGVEARKFGTDIMIEGYL